MEITPAARIRELPPYLFAEIDALRDEQVKKGVDVIDLGVGDPDIPTPEPIVEALREAAGRRANHRYPSYVGMPELRRAAAAWMGRRFGVELDPDTQICVGIGTKEAIAHFPFGVVDPGDVVLVPDPGYPVYAVTTRFCGGEVYRMPLTAENRFMPDLEAIPADIRKRAKILWFNYPNNPTSAGATADDYARFEAFCRENEIIAASDNAYSEVYDPSLQDDRPLSFLSTPGAMDLGIEFHSLSKTFNMTGWRIGFAAGNAKIVGALGKVKTNVDSGQFGAIQEAAIRALELEEDITPPLREQWAKRRVVMEAALNAQGIEVLPQGGTFYVWARVPSGFDSKGFTRALLEKAGVVVTPGSGFGEAGEGWFRISLTTPEDRLEEAAKRIRELSL